MVFKSTFQISYKPSLIYCRLVHLALLGEFDHFGNLGLKSQTSLFYIYCNYFGRTFLSKYL